MDNNNINRDLTSFKKATRAMIATNDEAYNVYAQWEARRSEILHQRHYTPEEIVRIIDSGSIDEQRALSRHFFATNGYYKQIIMHYATLLTYAGLLIPNPSSAQSLSMPSVQKRYNSAMDFVENMHVPVFCANCAQRALVDGIYFGLRIVTDSKKFVVMDLPARFCRSRLKDENGNDLIEFNITYFNSIKLPDLRQVALNVYPKEIASHYEAYRKGKTSNPWVIIPATVGICFPFFEGVPAFLSVIPCIVDYEETVNDEREKEAENIHKLIVQHMPHLNDGQLVFEPPEAEEMHAAAVGMLKSNKNLNVLTTYADVSAISSTGSAEAVDNLLSRIEQNIYNEAGVSSQLFGGATSSSLEMSLDNDMSLMMPFAQKMAVYITHVINESYGNSNVQFKFNILPITHYNNLKYAETAYRFASSGYSFLLPAIGLGLSQKDLLNLKDLENDVLKLGDKLKPLETSYTQSSKESGRPALSDSEKAESTIVTEVSRK